MTPEDFARLMKLVMAGWPDTALDEDAVKFYAMELEPLEFAAAATAVRALNRKAREFVRAPTAGQIRRKVIELTVNPPTWAEVNGACRRLIDAGVGGPYGGFDGVKRRVAAIVADQHQLTRAFIEEVGTAQVRAHLDDGGGGEARLRSKWEAWLEDRMDSYALADLSAPPSMARIERARAETARDLRKLGMGEVLAQLEPAAE
jgi:hypothetical protein